MDRRIFSLFLFSIFITGCDFRFWERGGVDHVRLEINASGSPASFSHLNFLDSDDEFDFYPEKALVAWDGTKVSFLEFAFFMAPGMPPFSSFASVNSAGIVRTASQLQATIAAPVGTVSLKVALWLTANGYGDPSQNEQITGIYAYANNQYYTMNISAGMAPATVNITEMTSPQVQDIEAVFCHNTGTLPSTGSPGNLARLGDTTTPSNSTCQGVFGAGSYLYAAGYPARLRVGNGVYPLNSPTSGVYTFNKVMLAGPPISVELDPAYNIPGGSNNKSCPMFPSSENALTTYVSGTNRLYLWLMPCS